MQYNFDQIIDRSQNHSTKYDERKKKFGTEDVIPLWIADMDFKTAQPIIDALSARAQEGIWGYTARPDSYFAAIRSWQKRRNGWEIDQSLMSFSLGVVQSLSAMVSLFTPEGGSVLIQTPVYSEFYDMTEAWNRHVLENRLVEEDGTWTIDWADFEAKLRQADLFLLCNPHNPVGKIWDRETLGRIGELCARHHVIVLSDEIHCDLTDPGCEYVPFASVSQVCRDNSVTCMAPTKTFNLAGLQTAAVMVPHPVLRHKMYRGLNTDEVAEPNAFAVGFAPGAYFENGAVC